MINNYLSAAMEHAQFELLPVDGLYFGTIPSFSGVYATGATVEECRAELSEILEEWVLLGISLHHPLPAIDGIELVIGEVA